MSVAIFGGGFSPARTQATQDAAHRRLDLSPGVHKELLIGHTEVIYYIPRYFRFIRYFRETLV